MYYMKFVETIAGGGYDLSDMLLKIDLYHIAGKLTDEERDDLYGQARDGAVGALTFDVQREIRALWAAVAELKNAGGVQPDGFPEFVQPTGAQDAYHPGDKVTYRGKRYICVMDACVWAPDVYPKGWAEMHSEE